MSFRLLEVGTEWFFGASLLAEVCERLGEPAPAPRLYEALLPYGDYVVITHPEINLGSAARYLGLLASVMGRTDEAVSHFERAVAANRADGVSPVAGAHPGRSRAHAHGPGLGRGHGTSRRAVPRRPRDLQRPRHEGPRRGPASISRCIHGMLVTVRLFAMLRERAGANEIELDLPDGARVSDALEQLGDLAAGLPLVMAVNREYAAEEQVLDPGDELALIPPVSGGSMPRGRDRRAALARLPRRARARPARGGGGDLPGRDAGGREARVRGLRGDGGREARGDRGGRRSRRTASAPPRWSTGSATCRCRSPAWRWPPRRRTAARPSRARARSSTA